MMPRKTKTQKSKEKHRPNGLIDSLRQNAPGPDRAFIAKANREARVALASAKASGPSQLSHVPAGKIQKLIDQL